ncbi:MAG: acyltransferase family protein [Clostridia bacterium]|nr:acyltransferase family protein [Clostridia bacterium]
MERNNTIDILKGIAILLVVFGHICWEGVSHTYLWGFHMAVFFFASGIFFSTEKYKNSFNKFFKAKIKGLIFPYIIFYLLTYIYWVLIESHFRGGDWSRFDQFLGLFYGTYNVKFNDFNGALWFLPCLFTMNIYYWFVNKINNNVARISTVCAIYLICFYLNPYLSLLPFGMFAAAISLVFFEAGRMYRPYLDKKFPIYGYVILMGIAIAIQILLQGKALSAWRVNETSDNPLYSLILPFAGIALYTAISSIIKKNRMLEWFGKNSLIIFAFHAAVLRVVLAVIAYILKEPVLEVRMDIWNSIVATVLTLIILYPVCIVWNTHINPWLNKMYTKILN